MTRSIVSNVGAPSVELGVWVASKGDAALSAVFETALPAITAGQNVSNPAFDAIVAQFLAETNQSIVG